MFANARFCGLASNTAIAITALLVILFPPALRMGYGGEKEDKDAIIKLLKEKIERQQKEAELTLNEFEATREREKALLKLSRKLINDVKERMLLEAQLKFEFETLIKTKADLEHKSFELKNKEFELQAKNAQALLAVTQKRMLAEIDVLKKVITDRETLVVKLQAEVNVLRVQAQNFETLARARQLQYEGLLELNRELLKRIAVLDGDKPGIPAIRDPNAPNPPKVAVNGRIEKIDEKDATLIQISLGTDHGVQKGHTLDVYRIKSEPKYLGMIRVLDARHQTSVAQFIRRGGIEPMLRVDDLVASQLRSDEKPKDAKADVPKDDLTPNPPAVNIKGVIEKIQGDNLVVISVGSDAGLAKGHTLDVYRTKPEAKYLGMIRIVEVNERTSVGRLIESGNSAYRAKLKEGDHVASNKLR